MSAVTQRLLTIAETQRALMLCVLTHVAVTAGLRPVWSALESSAPGALYEILRGSVAVFALLVAGWLVYLTHKLAWAAGFSLVHFWMVGMLLPFFNVLVLIALMRRATTELQDAGVPVGWLGPDIAELRRRVAEPENQLITRVCMRCGEVDPEQKTTSCPSCGAESWIYRRTPAAGV